MYNRILVPLDGSKRAEAVLPHVEELARDSGAKVIFLGVLEPAMVFIAPEVGQAEIHSPSYKPKLRNMTVYLETKAAYFRVRDIPAEIRTVEGPIVDSILDVATREEVDLVALASHGRTGISRAFYGSVASGILHQIDRPLLLIRSEHD